MSAVLDSIGDKERLGGKAGRWPKWVGATSAVLHGCDAAVGGQQPRSGLTVATVFRRRYSGNGARTSTTTLRGVIQDEQHNPRSFVATVAAPGKKVVTMVALHGGATAKTARGKDREGEAVVRVEGIEGMLTDCEERLRKRRN